MDNWIVGARECVPGVSDCAVYAAAVVEDVHGYNPAEEYRRLRPAAQRRLFRLGPRAALEAAVIRHNWKQTATPIDGAVAVIQINDVATFVAFRKGLWTGRSIAGFWFYRGLKPAEMWDTTPNDRVYARPN